MFGVHSLCLAWLRIAACRRNDAAEMDATRRDATRNAWMQPMLATHVDNMPEEYLSLQKKLKTLPLPEPHIYYDISIYSTLAQLPPSTFRCIQTDELARVEPPHSAPVVMSQLVVFATIQAKPGHKQQVEQVLRSLIEPTLKEPGCIKYDLHHDNENDDTYYFHEIWQSDDHLASHLKTQHFLDGAKVLADITVQLSIRRATMI